MAALSEDQAAVYDRQLRVWGVEVQKRLNDTKLLIIGSSGLAAEVAKNVVLAGVGQVTLCDNSPVSEAPSGNFLITSDTDKALSVAEGAARTLQAMNPLVKVSALSQSPEDVLEGGVSKEFDIVVLVHPSLSLQQRLDVQCREAGVRMLSGCIRGSAGFLFADLCKHTFVMESKDASKGSRIQEVQYADMKTALAVPFGKLKTRTHPLYPVLQAYASFEAKHSRVPASADLPAVASILQGLAEEGGGKLSPAHEATVAEFAGQESELAPVAAVLGGVLANEVVKVAGRHREPIKNMMMFSLLDGTGIVEDMPL